MWINGHYFHTDAARRTRLSALRVQDRIFHRRLFFDFVTATIIYVLNLKALIEAAARDGIIAQPQGSP